MNLGLWIAPGIETLYIPSVASGCCYSDFFEPVMSPEDRDWTCLSSCTNLMDSVQSHDLGQGDISTYHFTLVHKHASIPMSTIICTLPRVSTRSTRNTQRSRPKAMSNAKRKVGFKEEPGVRIFEKNPDCTTEPSCIDGRFTGVSTMLRRVEVKQSPAGADQPQPRIHLHVGRNWLGLGSG